MPGTMNVGELEKMLLKLAKDCRLLPAEAQKVLARAFRRGAYLLEQHDALDNEG